MVHRGRDEVCANESVGRQATDEEAHRQQPEIARAQPEEQPTNRRASPRLGCFRARRVAGAVGFEIDIGWQVAHEHCDQDSDDEGHAQGGQRRRAPAKGANERRQQGQEDQLAGGVTRREHA
jgi:hypothetical protein